MKFHHFAAFEKHLQETSDEHLSHLYAIICFSFTEKEVLLKVLHKRLKRKFPDIELEKIDYSKGINAILGAAENSLFCRSKCICIKNIEKISDKESKVLESLVERGDPLILLSDSSLGLKQFYQKCKKDLVVIDLTSEKPWEKEERFQKWALSYLKRYDKSLNSLDMKTLIQSAQTFDDVKQELDKLCLYCQSDKVISQEAFKDVCKFSKQSALWKISEEIVFQKNMTKVSQLFQNAFEISDMQALFGNLRFHLELALLLKSDPKKELDKAYRNIPLKTLEKYKQQIKTLNFDHLKRAFHSLVKHDKLSRLVSTDPKTLTTSLLADITKEKVA